MSGFFSSSVYNNMAKCICQYGNNKGDVEYSIVVVCLLISNLFFTKDSFRNTIRVSNRLDPDQDRPDM